MTSLTFKRTALQSPGLASLVESGVLSIRRSVRIFQSGNLTVPPIEFGDVSPFVLYGPRGLCGLAIADYLGFWDNAQIPLQETYAFELTDAVVHPPTGIVTVGDYVLDDTIAHAPLHLPGYRLSTDEVAFPVCEKAIDLHKALHATGGNATNHFHWMLEIVPRLRIEPLAPGLTDGVVLLPPLETAAQCGIASLLQGHINPLLAMGREQAIRVNSLTFVPNLVGYGFAPNPHLRPFFARLRQLLGIKASGSRRIYVARRDSGNRIMKNEAEVIALVSKFGFQSIELTGLSLRDQVILFASASHIVSPHGAGLANIIFCNEGTILCELQMQSYLNPCFRRLAAMQNMRYGCVVGHPDIDAGTPGWIHDKQWTVPLDRLEAVLSQITESAERRVTQSPASALELVGNLELTQAGLISGWVFDRAKPEASLELRISIDGKWIATVATGRSRPDVEHHFPGGTGAGFEFAIPPYLCDGKVHLINISVAESDTALPGCPFAYEFDEPPFAAHRRSSLNDEGPTSSDIADLAKGAPALAVAPHLWLDKRHGVHPIDRIGSSRSGYQPFLPYIVSFPERYANVRHGTVFTRGGDVWQGCCYLRDVAQLVEDRARIRAGASDVPTYGSVVVFATSMRDNYFHWHLDCLVSLHFMARNIDLRGVVVLGPPLNPWQCDSLKLLGVSDYEKSDGLVYANAIMTSAYTDGRGIFPDRNVAATFQHLRSRFDATAAAPAALHERLFVSRADAKDRVLENEDELWTALSQREFRRLLPSQLSYAEQIAIFSRANIMVATHGAAMTNISYAKPGLEIHEIRHASYQNPCYEHLSSLLGHMHHLHQIDGNSPYRLDVAAFVSQLDRTMGSTFDRG